MTFKISDHVYTDDRVMTGEIIKISQVQEVALVRFDYNGHQHWYGFSSLRHPELRDYIREANICPIV